MGQKKSGVLKKLKKKKKRLTCKQPTLFGLAAHLSRDTMPPARPLNDTKALPLSPPCNESKDVSPASLSSTGKPIEKCKKIIKPTQIIRIKLKSPQLFRFMLLDKMVVEWFKYTALRPLIPDMIEAYDPKNLLFDFGKSNGGFLSFLKGLYLKELSSTDFLIQKFQGKEIDKEAIEELVPYIHYLLQKEPSNVFESSTKAAELSGIVSKFLIHVLKKLSY